MEIIKFLSMPKQTPFAPEWSYVLGEDTITDIDYTKIASIILSKEKEIIKSFPGNNDGYTGLGKNSLTARFEHFNVFSWEDPEILKLKEKTKEKYKLFLQELKVNPSKVWIQCWANVLRTGEEIKPHVHSTSSLSYLGGHISIQCDNTSTVYINPVDINNPEIFSSTNVVGKLTIFQNCIPHYTTIHQGSHERITIAFDLYTDIQVQNFTDSPRKSKLVLFDDEIYNEIL
jgi:hypothetical protein